MGMSVPSLHRESTDSPIIIIEHILQVKKGIDNNKGNDLEKKYERLQTPFTYGEKILQINVTAYLLVKMTPLSQLVLIAGQQVCCC